MTALCFKVGALLVAVGALLMGPCGDAGRSGLGMAFAVTGFCILLVCLALIMPRVGLGLLLLFAPPLALVGLDKFLRVDPWRFPHWGQRIAVATLTVVSILVGFGLIIWGVVEFSLELHKATANADSPRQAPGTTGSSTSPGSDGLATDADTTAPSPPREAAVESHDDARPR